MTENNNLVTSTQGIIKEALHKLGFDEGMYDLIKERLRMLQVRNIMMLLDKQKGACVSTQMLMKKK